MRRRPSLTPQSAAAAEPTLTNSGEQAADEALVGSGGRNGNGRLGAKAAGAASASLRPKTSGASRNATVVSEGGGGSGMPARPSSTMSRPSTGGSRLSVGGGGGLFNSGVHDRLNPSVLRETIDAIRAGNDPLAVGRPSSASPALWTSQIKQQRADSAMSTRGAGGETYEPGSAHMITHRKRKPLYVGIRQETGPCLPRPLSAGLRYAADVSAFSELAERDILDVPEDEKTRLREEDVEAIYVAKCLDQRCPRTFDRMNRCFTLIGDQCKGRFFVLRQCGLGANAAVAICKVLSHDDHYTQLDLSGNNIGQEGGEAIGNLLRTNTSLVVLRLQSANLGEGGVYSIVDALHKNIHLTALDFSGISGIHRNNIWGRASKALGYMLQVNQVISYLNLSCCGIQRTAGFLLNNCVMHRALTHLDLSGNSIRDDCAPGLAKLLSSNEPIHSPQLIALNLDRNLLTDEGITKMMAALSTDGVSANSLEILNLCGNKFGVAGCNAIAKALGSHPSLQSLSISFNTVQRAGVDEDGYRLPNSPSGIHAIFKALEGNNKLEILKLNECEIEELPDSLVKCLRINKTLKHLDLSSNRFKDEGAKLVAAGMSKNTSLTNLCIQTCGISNEGGESLCQPLELHPALIHVRIHNTSLNLKDSGLLLALKSNTNLRTVDGGCKVTAKDGGMLEAALHRNKKIAIQRAGPQLAKVQQHLEEEKDDLNRTLDLIADEKRRRERLFEQIKTSREKHNAASALLKNGIEELQTQCDRMSHVQRQLENQQAAAEEATSNTKMKLEGERNRWQRKIEAQANFKAEAAAQVVKLKKQLAERSVDPRVDALEKELRVVEGEVMERKQMSAVIQRRLDALENPSNANAGASAGAKSPAKAKKGAAGKKKGATKKKKN